MSLLDGPRWTVPELELGLAKTRRLFFEWVLGLGQISKTMRRFEYETYKLKFINLKTFCLFSLAHNVLMHLNITAWQHR